jgi:glyoxylase-like metal-dependent hydrolase (beta-lactamase superfamily II)
VRAVSVHSDVIVVTSALLALNCVIVRGAPAAAGVQHGDSAAGDGEEVNESFIIDSPVLPEELELLAPLVARSGFPVPRGLLATHADWDHLLARIAFPEVSLGCAQSTADRLAAEPGVAQRELRDFDESLHLTRSRPLALGSVQPLPVPGRCAIGAAELQLHAGEGHTGDGMAVWIPWARVLIAGDYLSAVEIPSFGPAGDADAYMATLERLRPLASAAEHVIPGHGPALDGARALRVLEEDLAYLRGLRELGSGAELPPGRHSREQRRVHAENLRTL